MAVVLDGASSESSVLTVRCLKARAPSLLTLLKPKAGHVWWGPFSWIYEGVNALFLGLGSSVDSLVAALFDSSFWLDACSPSCVSKVTGARWLGTVAILVTSCLCTMLRRSVGAESGGGGEPSLRSYTPDISL